ncbi:MAG: bZIP transcription factor [Candidatus Bathyarchaeota archaeon]|nr:bZIP transcription factor [Candidatus Bathyarchaeota archaeon]
MNKQKTSIIILLSITLSMLGVSVIQAQNIQDSSMCYDYGNTDLMPIGEGNTIFQYTDKIGLWVQIQNPPDVTYRVIWYDPNGNQFRNVAVDVIEKSGADWGIVFDSINIAESTAKNKLGVWTVALSIDGQVEVETEFQIINYDSLLSSIQSIQDQIQDFIAEKDELLAEKETLEDQLADLQAENQDLLDQIGTGSNYEQLVEDYEDLEADYTALQASQGTTKMMMYASIVVALIAVVVAVYFGVMKK